MSEHPSHIADRSRPRSALAPWDSQSEIWFPHYKADQGALTPQGRSSCLELKDESALSKTGINPPRGTGMRFSLAWNEAKCVKWANIFTTDKKQETWMRLKVNLSSRGLKVPIPCLRWPLCVSTVLNACQGSTSARKG